ncbi:MAG: ABC transporter ATP-binding protein [bacterium]|nr:ABC transporter ATP-binding protein [bacterium]
MTSKTRPLIRFEGFEKHFGAVHAVKPLDLEIADGESFALLGPNGGGKTTILRALVGLHAPSVGRILIDGIDLSESPNSVRQLLSYVPQRVAMPDQLTAREVLELFAHLREVPKHRVDEVLEQFALVGDADRRTVEFSGGMVQRLGLAVALLKKVSILVLDEPALNLDPLGIERLHDILGELKQVGTTLVFSSHMILSAIRLADRVGVVVDGEMARIQCVPTFVSTISRHTKVRVVLERGAEAAVAAAEGAGATECECDGVQLSFKAAPEDRLNIVRSVEAAGWVVEEFHTELPDWDALLRNNLDYGETAS